MEATMKLEGKAYLRIYLRTRQVAPPARSKKCTIVLKCARNGSRRGATGACVRFGDGCPQLKPAHRENPRISGEDLPILIEIVDRKRKRFQRVLPELDDKITGDVPR